MTWTKKFIYHTHIPHLGSVAFERPFHNNKAPPTRQQNRKSPQTATLLFADFFCFDVFPVYLPVFAGRYTGKASIFALYFCKTLRSSAGNRGKLIKNSFFSVFWYFCRGPPAIRIIGHLPALRIEIKTNDMEVNPI